MTYLNQSTMRPILKREDDAEYRITEFIRGIKIAKIKSRRREYLVENHIAPEWILQLMAILDIAADTDGSVDIPNVGYKYGNYYIIPKRSELRKSNAE